MAELEHQNLPITDLKPAEYNPRYITPEELEELKKSLTEFGMVDPIIINKDRTVIGGHQRLKAAEALGWIKVPVVIVDLPKIKEKQLNIVLNKISGDWDDIKLSALIKEIQEAGEDIIGFTQPEVDQVLLEYDIEYPEDIDPDQKMEDLFKHNERVEIEVAPPEVTVKRNRLAFYASNLEQLERIREFFKTTRQGELDIEKLEGMISDNA